MKCTDHSQHLDRRGFLSNIATSASGIALPQLLAREGLFAADDKPQSIRPRIAPGASVCRAAAAFSGEGGLPASLDPDRGRPLGLPERFRA